ncbi:MAG: hypothetical protein RL151_877 [Bacteroidota bacterium]
MRNDFHHFLPLCSMLRYILYTLGFYFLFRFITGFLIPVVRTTLQLRKGFKAAKTQMEEAMRQQQAAATSVNVPPKKAVNTDAGDYLDFEEVK